LGFKLERKWVEGSELNRIQKEGPGVAGKSGGTSRSNWVLLMK